MSDKPKAKKKALIPDVQLHKLPIPAAKGLTESATSSHGSITGILALVIALIVVIAVFMWWRKKQEPEPDPIPDPIPSPDPIPDPIPSPDPIPDPIPGTHLLKVYVHVGSDPVVGAVVTIGSGGVVQSSRTNPSGIAYFTVIYGRYTVGVVYQGAEQYGEINFCDSITEILFVFAAQYCRMSLLVIGPAVLGMTAPVPEATVFFNYPGGSGTIRTDASGMCYPEITQGTTATVKILAVGYREWNGTLSVPMTPTGSAEIRLEM